MEIKSHKKIEHKINKEMVVKYLDLALLSHNKSYKTYKNNLYVAFFSIVIAKPFFYDQLFQGYMEKEGLKVIIPPKETRRGYPKKEIKNSQWQKIMKCVQTKGRIDYQKLNEFESIMDQKYKEFIDRGCN